VSIKISQEKCIRCGICIDECPPGAIYYGENNITYVNDKDCNDCGLCIPVCVAEAISQ
jgi:NAD-dependent dihydropyrimidine dehydrogenase PreA subunit